MLVRSLGLVVAHRPSGRDEMGRHQVGEVGGQGAQLRPRLLVQLVGSDVRLKLWERLTLSRRLFVSPVPGAASGTILLAEGPRSAAIVAVAVRTWCTVA
ncbi:hypothetical protein [Planotetraspora mira]|uniref:hypothetical protein n=1 Tax=Planotetraspora mira TaxID=58121 RepID=UPI001EF37E51|nr:hypothetical protein [Planotetraspora mira]